MRGPFLSHRRSEPMSEHFPGCAARRRESLNTSEVPAIIARRPTGDFFERTVELRQRLEADLERDFADAQIWILQKIARLLDASAGDEFDEVQSSGLLEFFAEIIRAHVYHSRHVGQRKRFAIMLANVITRARDGFRLGVAALQRE